MTGESFGAGVRRLVAWVCVGAAFAASAASAQGVAGNYRVAGTNMDGSAYSGTVQIVDTSRDTCRIAWSTGGTTARGICMRSGNVLSAAYSMGQQIGLVIYAIRSDGTLDGQWTVADQRGVGTEKLTPTR